MNEKLVLIDGNSILNRAFYGVKSELTNSKGLHTNAIYGFLNILFKILEEEQTQYLIVAFDLKEPTFRHKWYPDYKGTRKPMPEELLEQVPVIKEILKAMKVKIIEKSGYEADDILGTIAKQAEKEGYQVSIISGDKDLLQLATNQIKIRIPKTKKTGTEIEDYYTNDVIEKYGVNPEQIIDLKGLMGDSSDNIPGVKGIGEKTASKIISVFGTIENAYANIEEVTPKKAKESIKNEYEMALLSKKLATIKTDCDLDYQIEQSKIEEIYNENSFEWIKELEFKSWFSRFHSSLNKNQEIERNFKVVDNLMDVELIFQKIFEQHEINSNFYLGCQLIIEEEKLLGMSLTWEKKNSYFLKVFGFITQNYYIDKIKQLQQKGVVLSVLDLKVQLAFFDREKLNSFFDCSIAAYLLNPLKDTYYYNDIARDYLKIMFPSYEELLGKLSLKEAAIEKEKEYYNYYCYISYVAYHVYPILNISLQETQMESLYKNIEMPLINTLFEMEKRGIKVKQEELYIYGEKLQKKILILEEEIYQQVGEKFNINSPKQLGVILFEKLKLPNGKKTKTGYSTSADILERLQSQNPVINKILEYRQLTKLKSTYADGLAVFIKEDKRIHSKLHQTITATGRISSTEPNLQNIPIRMELGRKIRKVFVPKEDFIFLDADYSQIELRVLAHMSEDKKLIEAYHTAQDIHRITASEVFHTPFDQVTDRQRRNAKAVNFGIIYGISSFGLGQGLNIEKKEAESYINQYFETYPKIKEFLNNLVEEAKKKGYVTTLFGRRRPIPELSSSNFMKQSFGERVAMNSPIQGTAADIIKIAMIKVNERLNKERKKSQLLLTVHDELLVETHKAEIEEVKEILKAEMLNAANLKVPLEVEIKQGNNWYEAK